MTLKPDSTERVASKRRRTGRRRVLVGVRLSKLQILRVEHFAIEKDIDVSEAYRQMIEKGLNSITGPEAIPVDMNDHHKPLRFFEHRTKWIDPDGELGFNDEPQDGETEEELVARMEKLSEEQGAKYRSQLMFDLFGHKREPTYCAHCLKGDPFFSWKAADKVPVGRCQGCGEDSYPNHYSKESGESEG